MKYKSFIFLMLLIVSLSSYTQDKSKEVEGNIDSLVDRFNEKRVVKNNNGWFHYFIPKGMADTLTVKMSCVFEGTQTHPPHSHNEDEAFYIVKGPVNFHINNEERILNEGDLIYTPSGSSHNIQRINNETIKYLVIKREWLTILDKPYKVGKVNYSFDDCYFPSKVYDNLNNQEVVLLNKDFSDGLQITINKIPENESFSSKNSLRSQTAIYVIKGSTKIDYYGQETVIKENNTFYCPKGSQFILTNVGNKSLIILTITTAK
ncbi:MAG: cupin domain-containing protein [Paludibacter sp.]